MRAPSPSEFWTAAMVHHRSEAPLRSVRPISEPVTMHTPLVHTTRSIISETPAAHPTLAAKASSLPVP